jgi:hypothetical protein
MVLLGKILNQKEGRYYVLQELREGGGRAGYYVYGLRRAAKKGE